MTSILDIAMEENDAGAKTLRDYFKALLSELWRVEQGFSGKRPFGNSGWQHDVYRALATANVIKAELDEDGEVADFDQDAADKLILQAISQL